MIYRRKYLQFNGLVIDNYEMLKASNHTVDFKIEEEEYSFGHGSYSPYKGTFAKAQNIPLSITLYMKKLPCEYRQFYKQFVIREITRPGKLWAIDDNTIVWAYAKITSISFAPDSRKDEYRIEADFLVWEGVWHKADKLKTFLVPYSVCDFMDCLGYKEDDPCEEKPLDGDCCKACLDNVPKEIAEYRECLCCCDELTKDMALCYHKDLQVFYKACTPSYQIAYSCKKGNEFFADKYLGTKICTQGTCNNIIAGRFYSETEIPTTGYEIVIDGDTKDPQITINGNKNIIKGEHERLFIYSNGDVYTEKKNQCCKELLEPDDWVIPTEEDRYGWEIKQGNNSIVIDRGTCCGRACVYIQADSLTI